MTPHTPTLAPLVAAAALATRAVPAAGTPHDSRDESTAATHDTRDRDAALRRELNLIRGQYLRTRDIERRQIGLALLCTYREPWMFPILLDTLAGHADDVDRTLADHLADLGTDDADAALAWAAIHATSTPLTARATRHLAQRDTPLAPLAKGVIATSLREGGRDVASRAATLVETLGLVEMIPLLIHAQVGNPRPVRERGDTAWIMVGTQTAYVADLNAIVADGAVAFDPQLEVITEGTLLRVNDAVVTTARTEVHGVLLRMTAALTGANHASLGYDADRWRELWNTELADLVRERLDSDGNASAESEHARDREPTGVREGD